MNKEIRNLMNQVREVKKAQSERIEGALGEVEKLPDGEMKEYFKKSITLAKQGKLSAMEFLAQYKKYTENAS